ncbi:HNH endonuclease [Streptomyces sp. NPDC056713]|uniref:HNH endonuclease n=1 Tax=Streptomyces sp. NPDC056713 TaxID=3345921 RepID=UPI003677F0D1
MPVREFYLECISTARAATQLQLKAIADEIVNATSCYENAAAMTSLHTLAALKGMPEDENTRAELVKTYKSRMVPSGSPGNHVYNKLKKAPKHGICPLCGQRTVETLDHQMPKAHFPLLAVTPSNLVPACSSCNWIKSAAFPETASDQTLHPYFDDVTGEQWLYARVIESENAPPSLAYFVKTPEDWDGVLSERVRLHFRTFGLAELYTAHAGQEISGLRSFLSTLTEQALPAYLECIADSVASSQETGGLNNWRAVMYRALSRSAWFTQGGYKRF